MTRRAALAGAAAALAVAAPALADPEEPNEKITDPKQALASGPTYTGAVENLGDDDYYRIKGSGRATARITVTADACQDDTPALTAEMLSYETAFGGDVKYAQLGETFEVSLVLEAGKEYRLRLNTTSGRDITACPNTRVDYSFTLTGTQADGALGGTQAEGPRRLKTRPKLRNYACLSQSQGVTGFPEPTLRFTLRGRGRWIDRTTAQPVTARWTFKRRITTLYSAKGSRLYRFAHFQDARGRYLVEHPRGTNPLICR